MAGNTSNPPIHENKMGYMPVQKLIITMSLPMMVSMMVQALYNVVDSIFVAQVSENALSAISLAFPMQNLMIALGSGTGVGINALLSKSLGEKRFDRSNAAANTGLLLTFLSFCAFLVLGLTCSHAFIAAQTDNAEIIEFGSTYLGIVTSLSVGLFFQMTFERLLQSTGQTIYSMISQGTGAIVNIIFDPIMIFGLLGFPRMGIAGAAYATVLGQIVAAVVGCCMNLRFNKEIKFSFREILRPQGEIIKRIYIVGIPSSLMIAVGSVMTYFLNLILLAFSTTAVAVFGVYFRLQSFFFMPLFGLNSGMIPIIAFNYGARNKERIIKALRFAITLAVSIMIVGMLIFELFPNALLSMFNASDEMRRIGVPALREIAICFPFAGACIGLGSSFQAFGKGFSSLIISVGRQLVVLVPAAWLLARLGNVNYVWFSFPIAEIVSLILSVTLFMQLYRNVIRKL